MGKYAENTSVPSDRSRAEIEKTLMRYGASGFMYGTSQKMAMVMFEMENRRVQFRLHLPDRSEFARTEKGRVRASAQQEAAYEQAVRQKWRALALVIKAKLEAVDTGITEFEDEFMAHILLPGNKTVGDWMRPQIADAYATGKLPPLLPAPKS